jgi:HAD superfamily hydrolase (TIGR01549 family)
MSEITTILFDVGWPIIDETEAHEGWYAFIINTVKQKTGRAITREDVLRTEADAVVCHAPSLFSYVIWQFTRPDEAAFYEIRRGFDEYYAGCRYRVQNGVREVLGRLYGRFKLGIAANQPISVYNFLENNGILKFFDSTMVSDEIGFSKPDLRMFIKVLENLGATPSETIMIGDRQDNDITPAKLLGMKTIRLRIGPHKNQQIRYPSEKPDYEVDTIDQIIGIPEIKARLS